MQRGTPNTRGDPITWGRRLDGFLEHRYDARGRYLMAREALCEVSSRYVFGVYFCTS